MPIPKKLAKRLIEQYGYEEGKRIFYQMESEHSEAFDKAMKTAMDEGKGHTLKAFPRKKKKK